MSGTEGQTDTFFGDTADPSKYVPRPETEVALARLESRVQEAHGSGAVVGPPGMGKSLLLRLLESRFTPSLKSLYLPHAALSSDDLCAWSVGSLGGGLPAFPRSALSEVVQRLSEQDSALVLLIDDADVLPTETARHLADLLAECDGGLRLVLGAPDHRRTSRVLAALGGEVESCRLCLPLELSETRHYIETQLRQASAPMAIRLRFDAAAIARIQRLSTVIPRLIDILADRVVMAARPPGTGRRESDLPMVDLGSDMLLPQSDEEAPDGDSALRGPA